MKRIAICALFASAMGIALAATSHADTDDKSYPAFICTEEGTARSALFDISPWRVTRTGGSWGYLLCPVIKDNFGGAGAPTYGPRALRAEVRVNDHAYSNVNCSLWGISKSMTRSHYVSASSTGMGSQDIVLAYQGAGDFELIRCAIPYNNLSEFIRFIGYTIRE